MIVLTTPTGRIGRQLLRLLLDRGAAVRVIARVPARLDPEVRHRVEVITGTHDDPAVLDTALSGAHALFWLVPPNVRAESSDAHYRAFARVGARAIRERAVPRVVAVSSAGHGWPHPAGILSAAFAMDAELMQAGAAYRALCAPFFMENLLAQATGMREQGVLALANAADRPLATVATRDIAAAAATSLLDETWSGHANLPVVGPDRLSPIAMTAIISEALGKPLTFRRLTAEEIASALTARGAAAGIVQDILDATVAVDAGIYDHDQASTPPSATAFRTWVREVLRPAVMP